MPPEAIPELHAAWPVSSIHTVPDERRYDWRATVVYDEPISGADKARIATLGGRVIDHLENLNFLRVELPNASFPELRESPNVVMVEASGQVCEIE